MIDDENSKMTHTSLIYSQNSSRRLHCDLSVDRNVHKDYIATITLQIDDDRRYSQRDDHDLNRIVEVVECDDDELSIVCFMHRTNSHDVKVEIHQIELNVSLRDRSIAKHQKLAIVNIAHLMC